jgi:hypothetical protein
VQEEEVEEEMQEDLLRLILRTPSKPVDLVRDRDRVYGDCLPKSPQPRKWRSPTRVRQSDARPTHTNTL